MAKPPPAGSQEVALFDMGPDERAELLRRTDNVPVPESDDFRKAIEREGIMLGLERPPTSVVTWQEMQVCYGRLIKRGEQRKILGMISDKQVFYGSMRARDAIGYGWQDRAKDTVMPEPEDEGEANLTREIRDTHQAFEEEQPRHREAMKKWKEDREKALRENIRDAMEEPDKSSNE